MTDSRTEVSIDETGIVLVGEPLPAYDLMVEGRRVWSFRPDVAGEERLVPDAPEGGTPECWVPWPKRFDRFLDGVGLFEVRDPSGECWARAELRFGDSERRIAFVDDEGHPLVLDSKGRIGRSFGDDAEGIEALLDATSTALEVLHDAGVEAFLAYGTLLGAVREGAFIGHDNDVDLGYVSTKTAPVDVVRESLRLQRALVEAGMLVERYSGAGFQVHVRDGSGHLRGLDVFGGYWDGDRLALLGEIRTPFQRDWITPLSTVELFGRPFPAPAQPERLLEAMYGPGWRVPDPTFSFDSSEARDHLSSWFRGIRVGRNAWNAQFSGALRLKAPVKPHALAHQVHAQEPAGCTVVEIGAGRGQDAAYLAEQGHPTLAFDFAPRGAQRNEERARAEGWPMTLRTLNLLELRQVLAWGARLSREIEGPRTVMARHVADATPPRGREGLFRLCSMLLRGGGRLHLEFFGVPARGPEDGPGPRRSEDGLIWEVDPALIEAEASAYGGEVVETTWTEPTRHELPQDTRDWQPVPRACRMVVRWA